ncbi:hypothetical protein OG21DRAFT_641712 [Imleria badia]|nr:hypothetical protein OG21DRAFT_641712 [Imleria badia]
MLLSLLQSIVLGIGIMFPNLIPNPTVISDVWGGPTIVCDSVITIETTRLLLQRKQKSPFAEETNSLITRVIQLTIETGAVTSGAMALRFVIYNYDLTTDVVVSVSNQEIVLSQWPYSASISQLFVSYSMTRLYANCVLASLNARLVISRDNRRLEPVSTVLFNQSEMVHTNELEQPAEMSSV